MKYSLLRVIFDGISKLFQLFWALYACPMLQKNMSSGICGQRRPRCAVWSGPSLSANGISGDYRTFQRRSKCPYETLRLCRMMWICTFCAYSKTLFRLMRPSIVCLSFFLSIAALFIDWIGTIRDMPLFYSENTFQSYSHLHPDLAPWLTFSGSNYLCLEQISVVPKMFEPLKFDCTYIETIMYWSIKRRTDIQLKLLESNVISPAATFICPKRVSYIYVRRVGKLFLFVCCNETWTS